MNQNLSKILIASFIFSSSASAASMGYGISTALDEKENAGLMLREKSSNALTAKSNNAVGLGYEYSAIESGLSSNIGLHSPVLSFQGKTNQIAYSANLGYTSGKLDPIEDPGETTNPNTGITGPLFSGNVAYGIVPNFSLGLGAKYASIDLKYMDEKRSLANLDLGVNVVLLNGPMTYTLGSTVYSTESVTYKKTPTADTTETETNPLSFSLAGEKHDGNIKPGLALDITLAKSKNGVDTKMFWSLAPSVQVKLNEQINTKAAISYGMGGTEAKLGNFTSTNDLSTLKFGLGLDYALNQSLSLSIGYENETKKSVRTSTGSTKSSKSSEVANTFGTALFLNF